MRATHDRENQSLRGLSDRLRPGRDKSNYLAEALYTWQNVCSFEGGGAAAWRDNTFLAASIEHDNYGRRRAGGRLVHSVRPPRSRIIARRLCRVSTSYSVSGSCFKWGGWIVPLIKAMLSSKMFHPPNLDQVPRRHFPEAVNCLRVARPNQPTNPTAARPPPPAPGRNG